MDINAAFKSSHQYRGRSLGEHFGATLFKSDADLQDQTKGFFKLMATWVYRNLRDRKISTGEIQRFVLPDKQKLDFVQAITFFLVSVLRKRGLREYDQQKKSPQFEELLQAFDRTEKIKKEVGA